MTKKITIGNSEWFAFPDLHIPFIEGKVDTGASLCALHATNIKVSQLKSGKKMVTFYVDPLNEFRRFKIRCRAELVGMKKTKSSNGISEIRFVIKTRLCIAGKETVALVSLTNREQMGKKLLVGSKALKGWAVVDVNQDYVYGDPDFAMLDTEYDLKRFQSKQFKTLNIGILASNPDLYSNRRLTEAAKKRGHQIRFLNISNCYLKVNENSYAIHYQGAQIENLDAVIPRIKPSVTFYATSVLRQFVALGIYSLNTGDAIATSRDKLLAYQILSQRGIPIPLTGFAHSPQDTKELIKLVGGAPLVIKLLESTQGQGVILADTNKSAETSINAFKKLGANILVQEYIKEAQGADIRAFVIGKEVVGSIVRQAVDKDEFRSNIHLGGIARPIKLDKETQKLAVNAARNLGLEIAGVDIIKTNEGYKILEVNSSPGLEGIEKATGIDIADQIIAYLETQTS